MSKVATKTRMQALLDLGQSVWLDYLRRGMLSSGELQRLIDDGLRGMTSNPTIFEHAIGGSTDYDEALSRVAASTRTDREVFDLLAVEDVRTAADAFRPVYDASQGADGFISLEVSPTLARDTAGTVAEAHPLWAPLARRSQAPASLVGQHGHQRSGVLRCAVRGFADRRGHDQHAAAADTAALRGSRHRAGDPSRRPHGSPTRHGASVGHDRLRRRHASARAGGDREVRPILRETARRDRRQAEGARRGRAAATFRRAAGVRPDRRAAVGGARDRGRAQAHLEARPDRMEA